MPSLRRSLIGYFLLLLAMALGAVGVLVDRFAHDALQGRERAEQIRIDREHESHVADSQSKFDDELLIQAQSLGRELRSKYSDLNKQAVDESSKRFPIAMLAYALGDLGSPLGTAVNGAMAAQTPTNTLWFGSAARNARSALFWAYFSSPQTDERISKSFTEFGDHPQYFQIQIPRFRRVIRSPEQPFDFPLDTEGLNESNAQRFGTVSVPNAGDFHRVTFRTTLQLTQGRVPTPPQPSRQRGSGPDRGPPNPENFLTAVYVQCARPQSELLDRFAEHAAARDTELARVNQETAASLSQLRFQVGLIGGIAFVALAVGGWVLVGFGLSPLRKLSDAVSRVNEKDFRLPVEKEELTRELVPIHDRLTHSLDSLKRAFEREKEAIADISHELRTPVAGLLATLDVSLRKPRTAEQYKTTLEECRAITKQLSHLVERVMTLAYIDAGQTTASVTDTDASELAEGCAAILRPLAESHGLTLTSELQRPVELSTDPDKLREVMMNLLHNAVEYNRPGGNVNLRVRKAGPGVQLEVSDTGIGMTPDVQGKIFDRFFRADPSRTTTGVHAGLGLAIVKEYVRTLGGSIAVESQPGCGTTFRVELPAEQPMAV
jgi:two-component system, OmpR family, heavy metal sensor histidine kinase CusS